VCHSESKIDRALIDGQQYEEIVFLDGVPYRRADSNSTGNAHLLGDSASGGNNSTMMRHQSSCMMALPLVEAKVPSVVTNLR
jgi:hypothetical protein